MMLNSTISLVLQHWPTAALFCLAAYLARNRFHKGLNRYPGPVLASLTDWWRFFDVLGRRPDITHIRLHRKHGDIVRLGPNTLSFANPQALKTIYGLNKRLTKVRAPTSPGYRCSTKLRKSEFYPVQQAISNGERLPSLFSTTDNQYHADLRRCVNSAFSMSSLVQYEPLVDIVTEKFLDQTEALFSSKNAVCNFAEWLQFLAFDVIGQITYSKSHGFVDRGEDVDGMVGYLGRLFSYVAPV